MKYKPQKIVINVQILALLKLEDIKYMWALVIVKPEDTKINELRRGTLKGLSGSIPFGGQV